MTAILAKVRDLLQGEPARMIAYGAVVVVWVVTHGAFALGILHSEPPGFDLILAAVTGAIALITEGIRMFVYSPATVAALTAPTTVDPNTTAAPPPDAPAP